MLAEILGASWSGFGALLIGVGALLIALDTLYPPYAWGRVSYLGTYPMPRGRFALGMAIVGVILAAAGSIILAIDSKALSVLAVLIVLTGVGVLLWIVMAILLWRHLDFAWYGERAPEKHSLWWCLRNPLWTNEEATGTPEAVEYTDVMVRRSQARMQVSLEKCRELEAQIDELKRQRKGK